MFIIRSKSNQNIEQGFQYEISFKTNNTNIIIYHMGFRIA